VLEAGDLLTYGGERADHIAFWLGQGRILHATAREGLGVVEEPEPADLRARRRVAVRM
jgi:cell wall-associated NlpC family hydrolase